MIPALEQKIMKCKFFYSICDFGKFVQVRVSVRACVCVIREKEWEGER